MEPKIVRLSILGDPATITAGDKIRLVVELEKKPTPVPVRVMVEAQRLVRAFGGYFELRPTYDYFSVPPNYITVYPDHKFGLSDEIVLSPRPMGIPPEEPPLYYPEHLLFGAYVENYPAGFQSVTVRVEQYPAILGG